MATRALSLLTLLAFLVTAPLATRDKGKVWFEATVTNLVEFIREFRGFEVREKRDHH